MSDVSTFPALDPFFRPLSEGEAVAQCIMRRCMTPRGKLSFHPDEGDDLRELLNGVVDLALLEQMKARIRAQALRDERVVDASAEVSFDTDTEEVTVALNYQTGEGPFLLSMVITALDVRRIV